MYQHWYGDPKRVLKERGIDKVRRTLMVMSAILLTALLVATATEAQNTQPGFNIERSHGTVNVILANGDSLVAVTDSMLTFGTHHAPEGIKLYKVDDKTICTVAGFYSESGPSESNSLALLLPQAMNDAIGSEGGSHQPFSQRVAALARIVDFELTAHLQALVASNVPVDLSSPTFIVELTVAGYDEDNSLELAEITLAPTIGPDGVSFISVKRPRGPETPRCELTAEPKMEFGFPGPSNFIGTSVLVYKVGKSLFCDIAGKPIVAEHMLNRPYLYPHDTVMQMYSQAMDANRALSSDELRELAIYLEKQTADEEGRNGSFEVGGPVIIAMLSGGAMIEEPPPAAAHDTGSALRAWNVREYRRNCAPGSQQYGIKRVTPESQIQVIMSNCNQFIDGIFHDSIFINSRLKYAGTLPLLFADSNVITGSTLELGPAVNLQRPDVVKLICSFKWQAVYRNSVEVSVACPAVPAQ